MQLKEKKVETWRSHMKKTSKRQIVHNQSNSKSLKKVRLHNDYIRLKAVSLSNNGHPTGVVNLRLKDPAVPFLIPVEQ